MALTANQKQRARNWMERKAKEAGLPVSWVKGAVNDALDAIDGLMTSNAGAISTAINGASQPHGITFTAAQKKILFALWAEAKFDTDKDG
jgi:hypothetical protein